MKRELKPNTEKMRDIHGHNRCVQAFMLKSENDWPNQHIGYIFQVPVNEVDELVDAGRDLMNRNN